MPILQQNDAAAVARYTEFVTRSPWGNLMQDRGWAHVKKGWVGEQVYLEQNGEITAAMSIIFAPAVAGRTLAYAPPRAGLRSLRYRNHRRADAGSRPRAEKAPGLPAAL